MRCESCGVVVAVEVDSALGHTVCTQCGQVLEQNIIVSEIQFTEHSGKAFADGFSLKAGQARAKSKTLFQGHSSLRSHQDSHEVTRERGHAKIEAIASYPLISLSQNLIEKAKRVYDIALHAKYTRGRKSDCVVAACCYITCRLEKTSHMLIDFADALSLNLYSIGATFLQIRLLFVNQLSASNTFPIVDPSLYMARFADKLDFDTEKQNVIRDANRVSTRMRQDWIHQGRRPAGICAASLFIASRMNNFKRTIREIVLVVKICEQTLRSRLTEFQATESSKMDLDHFNGIWIDGAANPPSFNRINTTTAAIHVKSNFIKKDDLIIGRDSIGDDSISNIISNTLKKPVVVIDDSNTLKKPVIDDSNTLKKPVVVIDDSIHVSLKTASAALLTSQRSHQSRLQSLQDAQEAQDLEEDEDDLQATVEAMVSTDIEGVVFESLSDLDDDLDVLDALLTSEAEIRFRETIWEIENCDWRAGVGSGNTGSGNSGNSGSGVGRKKRKKDASGDGGSGDGQLKPQLSKKLNYEVMQELLYD